MASRRPSLPAVRARIRSSITAASRSLISGHRFRDHIDGYVMNESARSAEDACMGLHELKMGDSVGQIWDLRCAKNKGLFCRFKSFTPHNLSKRGAAQPIEGC
jgi:hypothetical protein